MITFDRSKKIMQTSVHADVSIIISIIARNASVVNY